MTCQGCGSSEDIATVDGGGAKRVDLCRACRDRGLKLLLRPCTGWEFRRWLEVLKEQRRQR